MKQYLRWLWPIGMSVFAVACFLTRDNPPATWWIGWAVLALASWVTELQRTLINELKAELRRRMEADL